MEEKYIKLTNEDIIKKINDLNEQLTNYKYHDNVIISLNDECQKIRKSANLISSIGFLISLIIAFFVHRYCLFGFLLPAFFALKKELKAMDIQDEISLLKKKNIDEVTNLKREIECFKEILRYRKSQEINPSSLRNLNVNFKNVIDASYDLKEMNSKYISKVLTNVDEGKMLEITNLIIDYLEKESVINNETNDIENINKPKEKVLASDCYE